MFEDDYRERKPTITKHDREDRGISISFTGHGFIQGHEENQDLEGKH